jgi:integrase
MTTTEQQTNKSKVWKRTRYQKLFWYLPSGIIFARFKVRGKQVRKSLKTTNLELAKNKLAELERNERAIAQERRRGKMLFGEALDEHLRSRKCDPTIKPSTKAYDDQRTKALYESWPDLKELDVRRVNKEDCERWAGKFAKDYAPSTYNHTLSLMKHAFETAIERGVRYDNPTKNLKRQGEKPKKLILPTCSQFEAFVKEIESGGSGKSEPCANLVRFLAFSGLRKGEAANVLWADVDFGKGTIRIFGDPVQRTKNGQFRSVPVLPEMRSLLLRLRAENPTAKPEAPVMAVRECQKAMNRAATIVGMKRITHHDLRHLFATRCIESDVDVFTVSRWLGHKDGGALAMKTYGHLRDEHSQEMARKVFFSEATRAKFKVVPKGRMPASRSASPELRRPSAPKLRVL